MAGSVGGIKAGKAFVLIEAVDATGKVLNSIRHRLGAFASELTNLGKTTVMRTAAAMLPVGFAVKAGVEFDDVMRKVAARSEGTAAEMDHLRETAISLAAATGLLPINLAKIQDMLAQKGFNRSQIADMMQPVADLTRAGGDGLDLMKDSADAAKILAGTLQAMHMPTSMTAEVADKLAIALNVSNFNLEELTSTLQYAAPAAHHFGVSLDDTIAVVSAMRDANIDATIAGTAFRNMLLYMSQEAERSKFNQVLKQMTGNTVEFIDASGKMHSLVKLIPALLKSVEGMSNVQGSDLLTQLLETRATIPATVVASMTENMARMLTMLGNTTNYARNVREEMDSGVGGAFRRFTATVYGTAIALADALAPSLTTITRYLQMVSGAATDWVKKNQKLVLGVIAGGIALLAFGATLIVVGQGLFALTAILGVLSGMATILAFAVTPLTLAFAAAAVAIYYADDAIGELTGTGNSFDKLFARIPGDINNVATSIERTTGVAGEFQRIGQHVTDTWTETFDSIGNSLRSGNIEAALSLLLTSIKLQFEEAVGYIQKLWIDMLTLPRQLQTTKNPFSFNSDFHTSRMQYDPKYRAEQEALRLTPDKQAQDKLSQYKSDAGFDRLTSATEARIKALQDERQALLDTAFLENNAIRAMHEMNVELGILDKNATNSGSMLNKILEGANSLVIPGSKGFGVAPHALEAIESTSIEAAKHFQENRYNAEMTDLAQSSLDVSMDSREILTQIAQTLRQLNAV